MAKGNIQDFVRDGHAWLKCIQCGAETTIIKWDFDHERRYEVINNEKTVSSIASFTTQHTLCKPPAEQAELFQEVENG